MKRSANTATTTTTTTTTARDQVQLCQKIRKTTPNTMKTTMMMRHNKVSKHHVRTFQIAVKRPAAATATETCNTSSSTHTATTITTGANQAQTDVHAIAKQLKQRLSKAMSKLAGADNDGDSCRNHSTNTSDYNNDDALVSTTTTTSTSNTFTPMEKTDMPTRPLLPSRLSNLTLLRQYLMFVAQETGTCVDIKQTGNDGGHQIEIAIPDKKVKEENNIRTCCRRRDDVEAGSISERCDAARLGARLIESHVHRYSRMRSVIDVTSIVKQEEESGQEVKEVTEKKEPTATVPASASISSSVNVPVVPTREEKHPATTPHLATRRSALSDRRRRPGRPPATTTKRPITERQQQTPLLRRSSRHVMSYTSVVKCICDTPDEEFGSMVQCDDCQRWLHLDCLKMSEAALSETFRCPLCFVALGGCKETNKLVSSITWRFAARRQSEQMAAAAAAAAAEAAASKKRGEVSSSSDDDSETSDYDEPPPLLQLRSSSSGSGSRPITHRRRRNRRCEKSSPPPFQQVDQEQEQAGRGMLSIVAPSPSTSAIEACNPTAMDLDDHCSTTSSSDDSSSPSEAGTPEQTSYPTDPFDAMDTDQPNQQEQQMALDSDSIEFFSRLAYLQSLDSMQKKIFAPNASDVFLCEDSNNNRGSTGGGYDPSAVMMKTVGNTPGVIPRYPADTLPSSMCSQLLKEFSFDSGPFWKTMR